MHTPKFGKDKKPKTKNEWFQFTTPMVAEDRDLNLLGVAFEDPRKGTSGEFTPQGKETAVPRANSMLTAPLTALGNMVGWNSGQAQAGASNPTSTPPRTPSPPVSGLDHYMTPCKWPRYLLSETPIYPNAPTPASGVEAIVKKVKGTGFEASIKSVLAAALHIDEEQLDKVVIPVLKRYQMEAPRGKIRALLNNEEYRSRLVNLFEQQSSDKKRILWIATSLVTCEGVERERIKNDSKGVSGGIQDPTKHIPGKVAANWDKSKDRSLKGSYSESIVLFMAYRRIKYEHIGPDHNTSGSWLSFGRGGHGHGNGNGNGNKQKDVDLDKKAITFTKPDGSVDRFWIEEEEAEGDVPAFFSPESAKEEPSVFEYGDTIAGAQEEQEEEESGGYPDGFFSESDGEQSSQESHE